MDDISKLKQRIERMEGLLISVLESHQESIVGLCQSLWQAAYTLEALGKKDEADAVRETLLTGPDSIRALPLEFHPLSRPEAYEAKAEREPQDKKNARLTRQIALREMQVLRLREQARQVARIEAAKKKVADYQARIRKLAGTKDDSK